MSDARSAAVLRNLQKTNVLSFLNRPAHGGAELIALKRRRRRARGIEDNFARPESLFRRNSYADPCHWFVPDCVTIDNLAAGMFAILGAVGIAQHIEFPNRVDSQQFAARAAGLHVIFRSARVLHAIEEKNVLLRPVARNRKIIAVRGIRNTGSAGFLHGEIDNSRIQRHEQSKLRPFSGRSFTCCSPTRPEMSAVVTLTGGASASTLIC